MKTVLKVLGGMVLVIALGIVALQFATSGTRDLGRNFVMQVSSGEIAEAHALLHEGLQETHTEDAMRAAFEGYAAYEEVFFSSIASSGSGTELEGTATTASGCSTPVSLQILDGKIIGFEMAPLCPE